MLTGDTSASGTDDQTYAFARVGGGETAIVALNNGAASNVASLPVSAYFPDGAQLEDVLTNTLYPVSGGSVTLTLPARSGVILFEYSPTAVTVLAPSAAVVGQAIEVAWETVSEVDVLGFNLLRATSEDAPRTVVYQAQARYPGKLLGSVYRYTDSAVEAGIIVHYWLEVRLKDGSTQMLGPAAASLPEAVHKIFLPAIH